MASMRSNFFSKPSHIFPTTSEFSVTKSSNEDIEFDEADMWDNMSYESEPKKASKSVLKRGSTKKVEPFGDDKPVMPSSSLPVNVPDWSKILKEDYQKRDKGIINEDFNDNSLRVPPHEYLARTRGVSHSVYEGRGRTLKGRDLSSVRNAILKKVGFED
ncbi:hypothetical protein TanjilG_02629 [Lupinus angustifolius]|uniref:Senescence regulator n=1 Tax=Lupinus angustifolius TaxID=3871 RepID=A0A4P1R8H9_LUPAN|nr:PREDICTED: uncharacterized protein LOC109356419 [Lupinus angustifolius]OIW05156.1 hypothetical protein TanjilG_02629 [Lupinus angustifolius]